jgi:hypothetical protein
MGDKMELTNDEKKMIITQHIKNVATNIFNLQVSLIAENALENPDQSTINNLTSQISKEELKKAALLEEYATLNTEE